MYLSDYSRSARTVELSRRRMERTGTTPKGDKLWTEEEDELCREFGDDYRRLGSKLPHRSYSSLRARCQALGLRPQRNLMTMADVSKLRRLYPSASTEELSMAFPTRTRHQLIKLARYYGFARKRRPFMPTKIPVIDAIRQRCFDLNYTMPELDSMAATNHYFARAGWSCREKPNYRAIGRAVAALDGELTVRWRDE